jgi:hypothetical protein
MPTGANLVAPFNPFSRPGYTFAGYWDTEGTSGGIQYYNASMGSMRNWDKNTTVENEETILYARWTAITYTVRFNANGGTGSMADQTYASDISQALRTNAFTRTSHAFQGWATSATGEVVYADQQSVLNLADTQNAIVTLWAVWRLMTYTVIFNGNGNTGGTMAEQIFTVGVAQALRANAFTNTGLSFDGWATTPDGPRVYTNSQSVTNIAADGQIIELFARWVELSWVTVGWVRGYGNTVNGGTTMNVYKASSSGGPWGSANGNAPTLGMVTTTNWITAVNRSSMYGGNAENTRVIRPDTGANVSTRSVSSSDGNGRSLRVERLQQH